MKARHGSAMRNQNNLLMKLVPGMSLFDIRVQKKNMSDTQRLHIVLQVLRAYEQLQQKKIIHGNITTTRILYDFVTDQAVFTGFGNAKLMPLVGNPHAEVFGTQGYVAPELARKLNKKKGTYSTATDVYALGATIVYFLQTGEKDLGCAQLSDSSLASAISKYCLSHMCHNDARQRPEIKSVIQYFEKLRGFIPGVQPEPFRKVGIVSLEEYLECVAQSTPIPVVAPAPSEPPAVQVQDYNILSGLQNIYNKLTSNESAPKGKEEAENGIQKVRQARLAYLREALLLCDQVILLDSARRTTKEYVALRREMEGFGIVISNRCLMGSRDNPDFQQKLTAQLRGQGFRKTDKYFYVTTRAEAAHMVSDHHLCLLRVMPDFTKNAAEAVMAAHVALDVKEECQLIIENLTSLAASYNLQNAVEARYAEEIKLTINDITLRNEGGKLTSAYLTDRLGLLRNAMNNFATFNPVQGPRRLSIFGKKENPGDQVIKIEEQYQSWLASFRPA